MTAQKQITEYLKDGLGINELDFKLIQFTNDKAILNDVEIFRMYAPEYEIIELSTMDNEEIAVLTPVEMKSLFDNFYLIVNCTWDEDYSFN